MAEMSNARTQGAAIQPWLRLLRVASTQGGELGVDTTIRTFVPTIHRAVSIAESRGKPWPLSAAALAAPSHCAGSTPASSRSAPSFPGHRARQDQQKGGFITGAEKAQEGQAVI
jgi:hypothetical protein